MPSRVLVVEDEVILAIDMAESLKEQHGFQVDVAHTLAAANRLAGKHRYDYAVLDLNLGLGEDTLALGRALLTDGTRIAHISGYIENEVKGTEGLIFVAKPFVMSEIETALGLS